MVRIFDHGSFVGSKIFRPGSADMYDDVFLIDYLLTCVLIMYVIYIDVH